MDDSPKISAIFVDKVVVRSVVVLPQASVHGYFMAAETTRSALSHTSSNSQLSKYTIEGCTSTTRNSKEDPLRPYAPRADASVTTTKAKTLRDAGLGHLLLDSVRVDWLRELVWFLSESDHVWVCRCEFG
jgi:hypothetical protein